MAVEVPTAWAAAPKERPCAIGLPMWVSFMVLKPSIPPSKPTQTTTAAVSEGMPPSYRPSDRLGRQGVDNLVGSPHLFSYQHDRDNSHNAAGKL